MRKIKILFFIHQLNSGGSQKVMLNLLRNISKEKFDVCLIVINNVGEFSDFQHPGVRVIDLESKQIRNSIFKIVSVIKDEQPDIIFSGISILSLIFSGLKLLSAISTSVKLVSRETNTLSVSNKTFKYPWLMNLMYRRVYKRFDLIICQSGEMRADLVANFNIPESSVTVINNPVDFSNIEAHLSDAGEALFAPDVVNLLAVGRLHRNKGFDMLLEAISKLGASYHLHIVGAGSEEASLKQLADALGVSDRVHFLGFQRNPYRYMQQADLFILSSRHEGFPNVVLEANACGTPVVAFRCPGVSEEIIAEGVNGFLVDGFDTDRMKEKIMQALAHKWDKYAIKGYIHDRFRSEKIVAQYEEKLMMTYAPATGLSNA